MSNINELRAELSRLERINQELNAELWEIQNGVDNATQSLVNFRNYMTATMDEGKTCDRQCSREDFGRV